MNDTRAKLDYFMAQGYVSVRLSQGRRANTVCSISGDESTRLCRLLCSAGRPAGSAGAAPHRLGGQDVEHS